MSNNLMKSAMLLAGLTLAALPAFAAGAVGETAPAFSLQGVDGKSYSLADYKGKVVVLEWVNPNCPFSDRHAREKTMSALNTKYGQKQVVWLGINSTNPSQREFLKPAEHLAYNQKTGINYPVLYDETGKIGKAYDAKTTPHMFIIDKEGKLAYAGGIDNDPKGEKTGDAKVNFVDKALAELTDGKTVSEPKTQQYGCSVKYKKDS